MFYNANLNGIYKLHTDKLADDHHWAAQERLANLARAAARQGYALPADVAEALCAQIRAETAHRWYTRQKWLCWRCLLSAHDGVPAGLAKAVDNRYHCRAMARRFGYVTP